MGKLAVYANTKDKLDKYIADESRKLYQEGLTYEAALRKAIEIYSGRRVKGNDRTNSTS